MLMPVSDDINRGVQGEAALRLLLWRTAMQDIITMIAMQVM